jgi:hypothetical protein
MFFGPFWFGMMVQMQMQAVFFGMQFAAGMLASPDPLRRSNRIAVRVAVSNPDIVRTAARAELKLIYANGR